MSAPPDQCPQLGRMQASQPRRREPLAAPLKAATTSFDYGFNEPPVSLQPVFTAALVASLGAFCFGFHLAVLNGPLAAIAAELGFAGQPVLEGLVCRSPSPQPCADVFAPAVVVQPCAPGRLQCDQSCACRLIPQVISTCLAGAAFGSLTGAKLAQTFGRKGTLLLDVIPLFLGAFLCATANSLEMIIAGRVVIGIGIGLASGLVPLFISEVCA